MLRFMTTYNFFQPCSAHCRTLCCLPMNSGIPGTGKRRLNLMLKFESGEDLSVQHILAARVSVDSGVLTAYDEADQPSERLDLACVRGFGIHLLSAL